MTNRTYGVKIKTNDGGGDLNKSIEQLLGGTEVLRHQLRTEMDMYELGVAGIPKKAMIDLAMNINLSFRALAAILNISERTLQRKKELDLLNNKISEHILQIAEVYSRGSEVFSNLDDFHVWNGLENRALGNKKPIELLSSRYGAQMVLEELGRIEHGIFA